MFSNTTLAAIFSAIQFCFGAVIGTVAAALAYRRRLTGLGALRCGAIAGVVFVALSTVGGVASAHESF